MTTGMRIMILCVGITIGHIIALGILGAEGEELEYAVFLFIFALFCTWIQMLKDLKHEQQQRKS
jgi:hypothetical protein